MTDTPAHDELSVPASPARGSSQTTMGVTVRVEPRFIEEESSAADRRFVFAYFIRIVNERGEAVQLLTRHWRIVDSHGNTHHVDGEGVVGKQPIIAPGEMFEYSSWCPLSTAWGTMEGHYVVRGESGDEFNVHVGRFYLVAGK